jgi:hypothetical protein
VDQLSTNVVIQAISSPDVTNIYRYVTGNLQQTKIRFSVGEIAETNMTFTLNISTRMSVGLGVISKNYFPSVGADGPGSGTQRGTMSDTSISGVLIIRAFP